jgi:plasmid stability protein
MATIQVKNVPPEVHAALRHKAVDAHQSLQEYVLSLLVAAARQPTMKELLDRAAAREGVDVSLEEIVTAIRADRDGH